MRSVRKSMCVSFLVLAAVAVSSVASAEGGRAPARRTQATESNVTYEFLDDPLAGGGLDPHGGLIKVYNRHVRLLLIRPRTQFVTEMLKSVENL